MPGTEIFGFNSILMQDNAQSHETKLTQNILHETSISPANSPNLTGIENYPNVLVNNPILFMIL